MKEYKLLKEDKKPKYKNVYATMLPCGCTPHILNVLGHSEKAMARQLNLLSLLKKGDATQENGSPSISGNQLRRKRDLLRIEYPRFSKRNVKKFRIGLEFW